MVIVVNVQGDSGYCLSEVVFRELDRGRIFAVDDDELRSRWRVIGVIGHDFDTVGGQ